MSPSIHHINLGIQVTRWSRFTQIRHIFSVEFRTTEKFVGLEASYSHNGDIWNLWLNVEQPRKPATSVIDNYRNFIRGAIAASYYYDPMSTYSHGNI